MIEGPSAGRDVLQRRALRLEYLTIAWNIGEGVLTIALGIAAASLALVGFGSDSFIEVFASAVVVWHIAPGHAADHPERTARALRLVATAFAVLAVVLATVAARDLILGRQPDASPWGVAYLAFAAVVMLVLAILKRRTAHRLDSAPLHAEATLTFLDAALAAGTTVGLALNAVAGWWWADPAAALVVAVVCVGEARENWVEAGDIGSDQG